MSSIFASASGSSSGSSSVPVDSETSSETCSAVSTDDTSEIELPEILEIAFLNDRLKLPENAGERKNSLLYPNSIGYKKWDFCLPTISGEKRFERACVPSESVRETFLGLFPFLRAPLESGKIIVAGGCLTTLIQKLSDPSFVPEKRKYKIYHAIKDADIFFVGVNQEEAMKIIESVYHGIREFEINGEKNRSILFCRSKNAISLNAEFSEKVGSMYYNVGFQIQFILRLYEDTSQVLFGFDLGSSMVALSYSKQQQNICLTTNSFGLYCLEHRINVVIPAYRSTTFEKRLRKYNLRGYQIVLPNLNVPGVRGFLKENPTGGLITLPFAKILLLDGPYVRPSESGPSEVEPEKSSPNEIFGVFYPREKVYGSDYQGFQPQSYFSSLENVVRFVKTYGTGENKKWENFGPCFCALMKQEEENAFQIALQESLAPVLANPEYVRSLMTSVYYKESKLIKMNIFSCKRILPEAIIEHIQKGTIEKYLEDNYYNPIVEEIVQHFNHIYNLHMSEVKWEIQDPAKQVCGSFNPRVSEPGEYYGEWYTERLGQYEEEDEEDDFTDTDSSWDNSDGEREE